jgi:hypothetical protein
VPIGKEADFVASDPVADSPRLRSAGFSAHRLIRSFGTDYPVVSSGFGHLLTTGPIRLHSVVV